MSNDLLFWLLFIIAITIMLYVDLYKTDHRHGAIGVKTSLIWSGIWISAALVFNLLILFFFEDGTQKAIEFFTGYLIEKSLSIDNLFVFIMIFNVMSIEDEYQPHVLKWGILSAIIMRIVFILFGVAVINLFHPVIYIFGLLLFYAAWKMAFGKQKTINLETNPLIKFVSKHFPIMTVYSGRNFFIKKDGRIFVTSIFLTFLLIESADIVFAIDSIPAVIAITKDPFIIITSNIFAILGLRALYFALAGIVRIFIYLKYGVAIILAYVGLKMILSEIHPIPTYISLIFISASITLSIVFSLIARKRSSTDHPPRMD